MSYFSDLDLIQREVAEAMAEPSPTRQPLSQWLANLAQETLDIQAEVLSPAYRFMSKEDLLDGLGIDEDDLYLMARIGTRLQLIAGNIDSRRAPGLKLIRGQGR